MADSDSFMVADSVPIAVPPAWEAAGQILTGTDAKPGQQQKYNYLNPAEIACWEVRARAYLEDRECLDAITDPRIKDESTFAAEYIVNDVGERPTAEEIRKAYNHYKAKKELSRRKAYNHLVQWPTHASLIGELGHSGCCLMCLRLLFSLHFVTLKFLEIKKIL